MKEPLKIAVVNFGQGNIELRNDGEFTKNNATGNVVPQTRGMFDKSLMHYQDDHHLISVTEPIKELAKEYAQRMVISPDTGDYAPLIDMYNDGLQFEQFNAELAKLGFVCTHEKNHEGENFIIDKL